MLKLGILRSLGAFIVVGKAVRELQCGPGKGHDPKNLVAIFSNSVADGLIYEFYEIFKGLTLTYIVVRVIIQSRRNSR
jgi:hypothetical protein